MSRFIYCDCEHRLAHHTDRGPNRDAGACLIEGCDCDEFIEIERDFDPDEGRDGDA